MSVSSSSLFRKFIVRFPYVRLCGYRVVCCRYSLFVVVGGGCVAMGWRPIGISLQLTKSPSLAIHPRDIDSGDRWILYGSNALAVALGRRVGGQFFE